ncbi:MAG: hypothetical protein NTX35_10725 [Verrucomicrobia bacterium]|nr:hypothetical protein [Verrucomicrobiota bacterium]
MQVSWIDANHLESLLAQITKPAVCAESKPQSVAETTEEAGFMDAEALPPKAGLQPSEPPQTLSVMPIETATDEPTASQEEEPQNSAAALPLSRIRDKLRAIRQRATDAGILVRVNEPSDTRPALAPKFMPASSLEPRAEPCSPNFIPTFTIPQGSRTERLAAFSAWAREVLRDNGGHVLVMSDDGEVLWSDEAKAGLLLSSMMAWAAAARASALSACGTRPVVRQALSSGHVLTVIPCETHSGVFHAAVAAPEGLSDTLVASFQCAVRDTMNAEGPIF